MRSPLRTASRGRARRAGSRDRAGRRAGCRARALPPFGMTRRHLSRCYHRPMSELAAPVRRPWLSGPASDLLLGCGGLFSIAFVVFALAGKEFFASLPPAV